MKKMLSIIRIPSLMFFGSLLVSSALAIGYDQQPVNYEGCDYDGLYYRDEYSFLICTHGIGYVQYCPRGTQNSGETKYQPYDEYSSSGFCDVNIGYYASVSYSAPSYPASSHQAPSHQAQSYPAPSYPAPSYPAPSYPAPSYPAPSYQAPSHPAPIYSAPSHPAPSYPAPSYPAPSYPAPSYSAPSYPAPSYPAPSYQAPSHPAPIYSAPSYPAPSYPVQSYQAPSYSAPSHQAPSYQAPSYQAPSYQAPSYPSPNHNGYSAPVVVGYQPSSGYQAPSSSSSYSIVRPNYSAPVAPQYAVAPSRHSDAYPAVYQAPSAPVRHSRGGSQGRRMGHHLQRSSSTQD